MATVNLKIPDDKDEARTKWRRELYELDHPEPVFKRPIRAAVLIAINFVLFFYVAGIIARARDQREAIAEIKKLCGDTAGVHYDYQRIESGWDEDARPPGPAVLRNLIGVDFFANVTEVHGLSVQTAMMYTAGFPKLDEFTLDGGPVASDELLRGLAKMKEIRRLSITNSWSFGDSKLKLLAGMTWLESLDLSATTISDNGLASLGVLPHLRELTLRYKNYYPGIAGGLQKLAAVANFQNLESIDMTDSSLTSYGQWLRGLKKLRKIVAPTGTSDEDMKFLAELPNLEDLDVGDGSITDAGLASVEGLTGLRRLILSGPITDDGLKHIEPLTELRELRIRAIDVTDAGLTHIKSGAKLRSLDVSSREITDAGLAYLKSFPNLEKLNISFCKQITDESLKQVGRIHGLRELDVSGTNVTSAGMQNLKDLDKLELLSACTIDGIKDAAWLDAFPRLRELHLAADHYMAGQDDLKHIGGLTELRVLDMQDAGGVRTIEQGDFDRLKKLRVLNLSEQGVNDDALANLSGLTELQELYLSRDGAITSDGVQHLRNLTSLRVLDLNSTSVDDDLAGTLAGLSGLHTLNIENTYVSGALITQLEKMRQLKVLYVSSPNFTWQDVKELGAKMPWCGLAAMGDGPEHPPGPGDIIIILEDGTDDGPPPRRDPRKHPNPPTHKTDGRSP